MPDRNPHWTGTLTRAPDGSALQGLGKETLTDWPVELVVTRHADGRYTWAMFLGPTPELLRLPWEGPMREDLVAGERLAED
jgi:hypothetical protein